MKQVPEARMTALLGIVAPGAGWVPPLRFLLRRRRILRLAAAWPVSRLLEVGCGGGALLADFAAAGHEVVGIESSARALSVARAVAKASGGNQRITDTPGDGWTGRFDIVCAFDVLEHIEDDVAALGQWVSWLRPKGMLCISVPAHRSRWSAGDEWAGHYRRYDRPDLEAKLAGLGLQIEHMETYGFPLANLTEWLGASTYRRLLASRRSGTAKEEASAGSGVDHRDAAGLFRWVDTVPGRFALRISFAAQALFARTDWGSGYLVLARKP